MEGFQSWFCCSHFAAFYHWEVLNEAYWVELGPPKMNSSKSWESTSNWGGPGSGFQCQGHHHQPCPQPSFNNAPWISSWVAVAREILGSILGLAKSHVTISHCIDRFCTFLHYPCFPFRCFTKCPQWHTFCSSSLWFSEVIHFPSCLTLSLALSKIALLF